MGRAKVTYSQYLIPEHQSAAYLAVREPGQDREVDLVRQWFTLPKGKQLVTQRGNSFIIVNHGQRNINKGPDIKGAVLFIGGQWSQGDVECHIHERDWYSHGHDRDIHYRHVVLHVVRKVSTKKSPIGHTVVLPKRLQLYCSLSNENITPGFVAILQKLGTMRWVEKVEACRKGRALEQLAKPLGSAGNEIHFQRLIAALNIPELNALPFSKKIDYIKNKAENIDWEHCGIRPAQWPEKRYELLAELISFDVELQLEMDINQLTFLNRLTAACPSGGRGVLIECCVNYFYPLLAVRALRKNDHAQYKKWYKAWLELKLPQPYGRLERKYKQFLTKRELCTVGYLQGLLQLEKEYCTPYFCSCCPLKKMNNDFNN